MAKLLTKLLLSSIVLITASMFLTACFTLGDVISVEEGIVAFSMLAIMLFVSSIMAVLASIWQG